MGSRGSGGGSRGSMRRARSRGSARSMRRGETDMGDHESRFWNGVDNLLARPTPSYVLTGCIPGRCVVVGSEVARSAAPVTAPISCALCLTFTSLPPSRPQGRRVQHQEGWRHVTAAAAGAKAQAEAGGAPRAAPCGAHRVANQQRPGRWWRCRRQPCWCGLMGCVLPCPVRGRAQRRRKSASAAPASVSDRALTCFGHTCRAVPCMCTVAPSAAHAHAAVRALFPVLRAGRWTWRCCSKRSSTWTGCRSR